MQVRNVFLSLLLSRLISMAVGQTVLANWTATCVGHNPPVYTFSPTPTPPIRTIPPTSPPSVPTNVPQFVTHEEDKCIPTPVEIDGYDSVNALDIVKQNVDTVTFRVNQIFRPLLAWMAAEYVDAKLGHILCVSESNVDVGLLPSLYTAKCVNNFTKIHIYAQDEYFSNVTGYTAPHACGAPAGSNIIAAGYLVPCLNECGLPTDLDKQTAVPTQESSTTSTRERTDKPTPCIASKAVEASHFGTYLPSSFPIEIASQNGATVEFEVYQNWKQSSISWMAVEYKDVSGSMTCPKSKNSIPAGWMGVFQAQCNASGYANVTLYLHDESWSIPDSYPVPGYCSPSSSDDKKQMFQYELPCKPACFEPPTPSQTIKIPTKKPTPRQTRVPSRAPFRVPTQAPTVSPTKVQSAMPTTVPSHRPIPLPSAKPTPKPSTLSTLHPSIRPTISPTTVSATLCVDLDAIEVSRVGPYLPSSVPIKVVSKNGATVEFEVYQYWKETSLSWMAVEYKDAAGRMVCPKSQNTVAAGLMGSFEAKCDSSGYANVTLYLHDGSWNIPSSYPAPEYCKPSKDVGKKQMFNFQLPCRPTCLLPVTTATDCVSQAELIAIDGVEKFNSLPIRVLSQSTTSVTFSVLQAWADNPVCFVATDYESPTTGQTCHRKDAAKPGEIGKYDAACRDGAATVSIFVHQLTFDPLLNHADIPDRCKANGGDKDVGYTFSVPCMSPDENCVPVSELTCDDGRDKAIVIEDFETGQVNSWTFGAIGFDAAGGHFLGPLNQKRIEVFKIVSLPKAPEFVSLEFDYLRLNGWTVQDKAYVRIRSSYLELNPFVTNQTGSSGFFSDLFVSAKTDAVRTMLQIRIPQQWFADGRITIGFKVTPSNAASSAGFDNVRLISLCGGGRRLQLLEPDDPYPLSTPKTLMPRTHPVKKQTGSYLRALWTLFSPTTSPRTTKTFVMAASSGNTARRNDEDCLDRAQLIGTDGNETFKSLPVLILSQSTATVTFAVVQTWRDTPISFVATDFESPSVGQTCHRRDAARPGEVATYTATCHQGFATVSIFVEHLAFDAALNQAQVPDRCKAVASTGKRVAYTFDLPCQQSNATCVSLAASQCGDDNNNILVEDFESESESSSWTFGQSGFDPIHGNFLGPLDQDRVEVFRIVSVPNATELLSLEFDFLRLNLTARDKLFVRLRHSILELSRFTTDQNETIVSDLQVTAKVDDLKSHFKIRIPKRWFIDGHITIGFKADVELGSAGFDNVRLTAACAQSPKQPRTCQGEQEIVFEDYETPNSNSDWKNGPRSYSEGVTTFLGRFGKGSPETSKTFVLPDEASQAVLIFCIYILRRSDRVSDNDNVFIAIGQTHVGTDVVRFPDRNYIGAEGDIQISQSLIGVVENTEKVQISIWEFIIPRDHYPDGELKISFLVELEADIDEVSIGFDNLVLTANCDP